MGRSLEALIRLVSALRSISNQINEDTNADQRQYLDGLKLALLERSPLKIRSEAQKFRDRLITEKAQVNGSNFKSEESQFFWHLFQVRRYVYRARKQAYNVGIRNGHKIVNVEFPEAEKVVVEVDGQEDTKKKTGGAAATGGDKKGN